MNQRERLRKTIRFTMLIIAGGLAIAAFVMKGPLDMSCKLYQFTGYSCSGCGLTRMVKAIMHGQFYQAFRYNSFMFLSIPVIALFYVIGAYRYIKYHASNDWVMMAMIIYTVLLAVFGVIRNFPIFHWLLPTVIY